MLQLDQMTEPQIEAEVWRLIGVLDKTSKYLPKAKADYDDIDELKKIYLAAEASKHEVKSEAERKRLAEGSNGFKALVEANTPIKQKYFECQIEYDVAVKKIEVLRTVLATRREAMRNLK